MKVVIFSDASFSKKPIYVYDREVYLNNTLSKQSSARESFNIRQKLGLFVLGVTHMLNLLTVCVKLTQVDGWV